MLVPRRTALAVVLSVAVVTTVGLVAAPGASASPTSPRKAGAVAQEPSQDQLPLPTASPEEVRQAADEVLARPEFRRPEPNLIEKAESWVQERVGRVLQALTSGDGASLIGWGVMLTAIAAIVFLLARFSRSVQRDPRRTAEISVDRRRTADEWDAEAELLEGDGEWKLALRCRFRSLLAVLVDDGHVDDVPGRTAGEYRTEVGLALPAVSADFAAATMLFEDAWYGDEPTGEAESRRFIALGATVRRGSRETPSITAASSDAGAEAVPA